MKRDIKRVINNTNLEMLNVHHLTIDSSFLSVYQLQTFQVHP